MGYALIGMVKAQACLSLVTRGPGATRELGRRIGEQLAAGSVIALVGELGCGKTCFAAGLCAGLGIARRQVSSPTFALVNEYRGRFPVLHLDLYRIDGVAAALEAGMMDCLSRAEKGAAIIEWADRVLPLLPDERLTVGFDMLSPRRRRLRISARGRRFVRVLRALEAG